MKVYVKVKKDGNSGLVIGHSSNFQKAISGFGDMGFEVIPYYSLDEVYEKITKEDMVVDYIAQCQLASTHKESRLARLRFSL